jgi:Icc-related predicted phosphoesterase
VRIVCISDTHGSHDQLRVPEGDILIHAGDFMASGRRTNEIVSFNNWLARQPHPHKIVIAGNHDLLFESHPETARSLLTSAVYLENDGITIEGLRTWGSPVQPRFLNWAFNVDRGLAIRKYWDRIPSETDVLVTHGPPFGTLDTITASSDHLGCEELALAVERVKPKLHVFGHIHGGHGASTHNGTQFINASVLDEQYRTAFEPLIVELDQCTEPDRRSASPGESDPTASAPR